MRVRFGKYLRAIPYILMMAVFAGVMPSAFAGDKAQDHLSKGMVLAENGDLNGAIVEYRKALKINPDFAAAHNNLGLALVKKNKKEAQRQLKLAASDCPRTFIESTAAIAELILMR